MGLVGTGVDRVRAFGLAAGVADDGATLGEPLSVLVAWRSEHEDKLHQVYVNGELAGVTCEFAQRMLVIALLSSWSSALRIEVYAVDPCEAHIDFGGEVDGGGQKGRVEIGWLRRMELPTDGVGRVYSNNGAGAVDYDAAASGEIENWRAWQDKGGWGLSRFGLSDFGFDGSAAVGFGLGVFGRGEFGFDADWIQWVSGELANGLYKLGVKVADAFGNESGGVESDEVAIVRAAGGVDEIAVESYDENTDELVIDLVG